MRVVCLAHAGGHARPMARLLAGHDGLHPVPVDRRGTASRWAQPHYRDWPDAVGDLLQQVTDARGSGPYALFGHSFGALLAHELAHHLQQAGDPPELLVLSGRNPPHLPSAATAWRPAELTDEQLFDRLVAIGGADPRAAGALTYQTFLPGLRADLTLAATYRPAPGRPPLTARMLVLYGTGDPLTQAHHLPEWGRYTTAGCTVVPFAGGHFFLSERRAEVAALVQREAAGRRTLEGERHRA
jgi:surfactin synthase thioesterase subunit